MSSLESLADESPNPDDGESQNHDGGNAVIPGQEPGDDEGESPSLTDLLGDDGDDAGGDDGDDDGESGSESNKTPERLTDLAETLKVKPEDLYKLQVAMSDGSTKTIGELKDLGQKGTDFDAANLELETRRQEQEAKFTAMHGELAELFASLPEAARKTEAMEKAAQRWQAKVEQAQKDIDSSFESWKDPEVKKADRDQMAEFLRGYGFEADYLDKVLDPRTVKFIRDATRLHKRVTDALSKVKRAGPGKKPKGSGPSKPLKRAAPESSVTSPANAAYDSLLD